MEKIYVDDVLFGPITYTFKKLTSRYTDLDYLREFDIFKRCLVCGKEDDIHLHHLIPTSKGGLNHYYNLFPFCKLHHFEIHRRGYNNELRKKIIDRIGQMLYTRMELYTAKKTKRLTIGINEY